MTKRVVDGPARAPGRPRSEQAERAILDAALELMGEHSIAAISMEAIAARAGVAKTTVYRRWSSKEELLMDALVRSRGPVIEPPPGGGLRDQLVWYLIRMRTRWQEGGAPLLRRLIAELDQHPELAEEYWRRVVGPRRELLHGMLRREVAAGSLRSDVDIELLAEMLVAPVLTRAVIKPTQLSDTQIATLVDMVLAGARPG